METITKPEERLEKRSKSDPELSNATFIHLTHVRSFISERLSRLSPVSDSKVGLILYNYPSPGNDCISSFQTDNSIWTQVIRFLGCSWYLTVICPVKQGGTRRRARLLLWREIQTMRPAVRSFTRAEVYGVLMWRVRLASSMQGVGVVGSKLRCKWW